jgi:threonine aldolase
MRGGYTPGVRSFFSDNGAGLCPEALAALIEANDGGHAPGYGNDTYTEAAAAAFRDLFGEGTHAEFVATGTAANTLAIASLTERWDYVVCHPHSHWACDESTAPERITQCRTMTVATEATRLTPEDIRRAAYDRGDVHQPQPGVVTVSNPSELGIVYSPDQMREICEAAHAKGFRVHVDGARFANAVAALGCHPREITRDAGVDALSFGGTKNGLAFGEAVLFFPQGDGRAQADAVRRFPFHRKGTGHLLSKHRFVSAPFAATLRDDVWLEHARHANESAAALARGLTAQGHEPRFPCETNAVFLSLPARVDTALREAGHHYYPFGDPSWNLLRLMCSFDTSEQDVASFLELAARAHG